MFTTSKSQTNRMTKDVGANDRPRDRPRAKRVGVGGYYVTPPTSPLLEPTRKPNRPDQPPTSLGGQHHSPATTEDEDVVEYLRAQNYEAAEEFERERQSLAGAAHVAWLAQTAIKQVPSKARIAPKSPVGLQNGTVRLCPPRSTRSVVSLEKSDEESSPKFTPNSPPIARPIARSR